MISLVKKSWHRVSANHNPELQYVIYSLVLHLYYTAISQSESSNFFMYIINNLIYM